MTPEYTPIDCGLYDHLEIHAMRGSSLDVVHVTPRGDVSRLNGVRLVTIRQVAGEELAVFHRHGEVASEVEVRLDRLRTLVDRSTGRRLVFGGSDGA